MIPLGNWLHVFWLFWVLYCAGILGGGELRYNAVEEMGDGEEEC